MGSMESVQYCVGGFGVKLSSIGYDCTIRFRFFVAVFNPRGGAMISSKHMTILSLVALSGAGIAIFTILRQRNSSSKTTSGKYVRKAEYNDDRISQLPDDVLIKIISLTRTKDAVRTSILSKRWRNLYKFSSNIDFHCFNLFGSHHYDCEIAIINLSNLKNPKFNNQYNSLETIRLMYVRGLPGALEFILSNCLSLQSLTIRDCEFPSKLYICGPNLQLKTLIISDCKGVREIEFYASNLITFEFQNHEMVNFVFDHVPQLQNFYIDLFKENVMSYVCGRLAKDLPPQLKSLTFVSEGDFNQESIPVGINMFGNLKRLELRLIGPHKSDLLSLTLFLHSCPLLEEFHFVTALSECDAQFHTHPKKVEVSEFHSHLKKVEMSGFRGTVNEINLALYILKTTVCLEQMRIKILELNSKWELAKAELEKQILELQANQKLPKLEIKILLLLILILEALEKENSFLKQELVLKCKELESMSL
ncbi:hypothetical protein BUALT_Bualt08G0119100 [Buddleja alternifolia]|uniref:F-box domain-containing protein n=1 Tax=Buddleja alternifolia TaxID=168488 RepID=A0AAV6X9J7_9LAMI|nr:hypothetical protein BUALT_Bualt08G0119100 [Buddleja alternifolia]